MNFDLTADLYFGEVQLDARAFPETDPEVASVGNEVEMLDQASAALLFFPFAAL